MIDFTHERDDDSVFNTNSYTGFQDAARNNQTILAQAYLVEVVEVLVKEISSLKGQLANLSKPEAKKAPAKKAAKPKTDEAE